MAISATTGAAPSRQQTPSDTRTNTPNVEAIMAGIRRTVRDRAEEGSQKTEREFRADLRKRMMEPLTGRGFSDDFIERVRSQDAARWNLALTAKQFHGASAFPLRILRVLLAPLARLLVDLHPAVEMAARQAEINEYHRRLLWATNRELELSRLELDLLKRELRGLGVHVDFSFARPSGGEAASRSGSAERRRGEGRGARGDRARGNGRRPGEGRSHRDGGGRRDRPGRGRDGQNGRGSERGRGGRSPDDGRGGGNADGGRGGRSPDGGRGGRSPDRSRSGGR